MKRCRYVFDPEYEMRDGSGTLTGQRQRRFIYHGTSIMYDAMTILYKHKINDTTTTTTTTTVSTFTTTTTVDDNNHSTSFPSSLLHEEHKECDDIYVTACTLFHRYYWNSCHSSSCRRNSRSDGNNHHSNSNQLRDSKSRMNNNNNYNYNDDDDFDDVWSVSMACLLLACKLHDISTNQISISDIIYTFCVVIYRQRILLPSFIPTIPMTTATTTTNGTTTTTSSTQTTVTVDVIAQQKDYYTNNILPFVPNKWQQLSTGEQQQQQQHVFHQPSDTTTTKNISPPLSFLSKSGPLHTEWYNAIVQMECQILYALQYRIYDIPDRPSIYQYIPTLAQRYIDCISPSITSNNNKISGTVYSPTQVLTNITTQAYIYCRLAVQIITWMDHHDHHPTTDDSQLQVDHHDVTIPQIIAYACLYCSIMTLGVEDDTIQKMNQMMVTNHNNTGTPGTNHNGHNDDGIHSEIWKLLLFPTPHDQINPSDKKLWLSIQNEIDTIIHMLYRTIQDPDYYIAQSNYCLFTSTTTTTTTTKNSFHGPDSFTWHRCITNII